MSGEFAKIMAKFPRPGCTGEDDGSVFFQTLVERIEEYEESCRRAEEIVLKSWETPRGTKISMTYKEGIWPLTEVDQVLLDKMKENPEFRAYRDAVSKDRFRLHIEREYPAVKDTATLIVHLMALGEKLFMQGIEEGRDMDDPEELALIQQAMYDYSAQFLDSESET